MLCLLRWPRASGGKSSKEQPARRGEAPVPPRSSARAGQQQFGAALCTGAPRGSEVPGESCQSCGLQRGALTWGLLCGVGRLVFTQLEALLERPPQECSVLLCFVRENGKSE